MVSRKWQCLTGVAGVLVPAALLLGQAPATAPAPGDVLEGDGPPASQPAEPSWFDDVRPFSLDRPTMTDNWFGLGKPMKELGLEMKFFWLQHWYALISGGLEGQEGANKPDATMDWFLTADLEKMGLIPGGEILVHAREQWGGSARGPDQNSINRLTGANQQINDDADGTRPLHIDQLWYRQWLFDRKLAIQLGHLDYQAIIDRNVYANSEDTQFSNAAFDNNPVIPSAGQTGLGVAVTIRPCDWYSLILGIGDAQRVLYQSGFGTAFHDEAWFTGYMEHGFKLTLPSERGPLTGNYRFGMVYDPLPRPVYRKEILPPRTRGDDYGFYLSFDQMLLREGPADEQGLGAFFRYGYRHDDLPSDAGAGFFSQHWSGGLVYTGLVPTRDKDVLGFAVGQLLPSQQFRDVTGRHPGNETIYELYYAIPVTPWLVVTPDFQYVHDPNGGETVSHAFVGGIRVRATF